MKQFIVIVLDGFGIGYTDDVPRVRPQDIGANTCRHLFKAIPDLYLPNLEKLGLMNALGEEIGAMSFSPQATYGKSGLAHFGADTFYGHQELLGTKPRQPEMMPFADCIHAVHQALSAKGYQVEYRGERLRYLVVAGCVTIADNIEADPGTAFNVSAALDYIAFDEVIKIGKTVRDAVVVSRVIALGGRKIAPDDLFQAAEEIQGRYIGINCPKSGVYNHGYQVVHLGYGVNPAVQIPTLLGKQGIAVTLLGKVADIVANPYGTSIPGVDTGEILRTALRMMSDRPNGLIVTNVQETDLAAHQENSARYAEVLKISDHYLGKIIRQLRSEDILLVMADHGNDPTIGHSHHTREHVPLLLSGPGLSSGFIGLRQTLSDVGATVARYFGCPLPENGQSFLPVLYHNCKP